MLAKVIGLLLVVLALGGVATYYATSDCSHSCPLSGAAPSACSSHSDVTEATPCSSASADVGCCPLSRSQAITTTTPEFVGPPEPAAK